MEDHLFLYCAFKNLNFVSYFRCFNCHNTLSGYKYWPTVTKKKKKGVFNVMYGFKHVFLYLYLEGNKLGLN